MVKKAKRERAAPLEKAGASTDQVETALEQAQGCVDRLAFDEALEHYRAALKLAPDNVAVLDGMGEACVQLGDIETAQQVLERSVALAPDGDAGRYMNLGQMSEGEEALRWYESGVQRLRAERGALEQASGSRTELQERWATSTQALATALCSVAEMFMTDFCDEPEAEQRCEALACEAVELVQGLQEQLLAEPYQTLASLRLSQERPDEAGPLLDKVLAIIQATVDTPSQPPPELRVSTAKLLMEVGRPDDALELLQALRMEQDDSLELWYLLCCAALQADEVELAAAEAAAALEFAESDACPEDEKEWMEQLQELQADIAESAAAAPQ